MAKREMSATLKNLKFMQRGAQKEEKPKKEVEETKPDGKFNFPSNVSRKCVVIMEGDPHPGTVRGRMSFQNFNPTIDKLKDEAANGHEAEASTSSSFQTGRNLDRENDTSDRTEMNKGTIDVDEELKRKQPETLSKKNKPKKLQKDGQGNKQPSPSENSSHKQSKRDKLDYNVLVPPKSQSKRRGDKAARLEGALAVTDVAHVGCPDMLS
uniref:M-phase phosphoprotein 6 n=1 Tax=Chenopodium quinoa TaxID=63459 RepID=A0A803LCF8_CHEQI